MPLFRQALALLREKFRIEKMMLAAAELGTDEGYAERDRLHAEMTEVCDRLESEGLADFAVKIHSYMADSDDYELTVDGITDEMLAVLVSGEPRK